MSYLRRLTRAANHPFSNNSMLSTILLFFLFVSQSFSLEGKPSETTSVAVLSGDFERITYTLPSADGLHSLQFANLNSDDWPDVIISVYAHLNHQNGVYVYLHTQNRLHPYESCTRYPVSKQLRNFAVGDVDGDGDLDLVVPDSGLTNKAGFIAGNSSIQVLCNDGRGAFSPGQKIPVHYPKVNWPVTRRQNSPLGPVDVKLVDLDGNGSLDLVLSRFGLPNVDIFLNDKSGNYVYSESIAGTYFSPSVAAGDLNKDGLVDLVFVHGYLDQYIPNQVAVALQSISNGKRTWIVTDLTKVDGIGADAWGVALSDLDADGSLDCVVTHVHDFALTGLETSRIMLGTYNQASGRMNFQTIDASLREPLYPRIVDFNGDGKPDILVSDHVRDQLLVLLNPGPPSGKLPSQEWNKILIHLDRPYPFVTDGADVNHDGKMDLAVPFLFDKIRDGPARALRIVPSATWQLLLQK